MLPVHVVLSVANMFNRQLSTSCSMTPLLLLVYTTSMQSVQVYIAAHLTLQSCKAALIATLETLLVFASLLNTTSCHHWQFTQIQNGHYKTVFQFTACIGLACQDPESGHVLRSTAPSA